ncbi:multidrug RND transporter [Corynebacterium diphtheriae]|uniref:MMPL family transporter n=1 Tax=Corynebacterium diphtheriae TaxID=1717 RepID=UPI000A1F8A17|nr:MMPL family transporter [Corynebacterium diphtheriae]OSQ04186.1 multidrug RND transporter [Corynebacterium diphtheriae]
MAAFLYRVGAWSFRAKWFVIVTWLVVLAAVGGAAAAFQAGFNDLFTINNTPAKTATEIYLENFPEQRNPLKSTGVNIVFKAPEGHTLAEPENKAAVDSVVQAIQDNLEGLTNTQRFGNPVDLNPKLQQGVIDLMTQRGVPEENARADAANLSLLTPDETIGYTTFDIDVPMPADVSDEQRQAITDAMNLGREKGLTVEAGGAGFGDPIVIEETSEIIGVAIAAIILIFTFGSLVAAGLPLLIAVIGVGIGSLSITLATAWVSLNNVTPVLAVMLGLAVGIDYSLFIMFRYRRELLHMGKEQAAGMAVGTAGSAVVFAGLTVIIALVALAVANIPFLTYMGLAAAFTVFIAVLIALTMVPALLGALGDKAFAVRLRRKRRTSPARTLGRKWVELVHRAPGVVIAVSVVTLGALTLPALQLHLSLPSDTQASYSSTQRKQAEIMAEGFGPGINSPFLVVADAHSVDENAEILEPLIRAQNPAPGERKQAAANAAYQYIIQKYSVTPDVKHVQIVGLSEDGLAAQLLLTPESSPEDDVTKQLIDALLIKQDEVNNATGIRSGITGLIPVQQDVTNRLAGVMPLYLGIVVGLAVLLLMIVFRSIWVPVVAGVGFLLSVGAAFGVTVLFWQEGLWGLVDTPSPIIAFMPIFLIGVCFGLAMDYQVFLVSAMRERFVHGRIDATSRYNAIEESIVEGFASSVRVVTAAALIMIAVFVAFIGQPIPFIKIFGFALGAGVLFDAFFIRMAFVPAAMFLLGRQTWYMPRWLDKVLPRLDVEGTSLEL